MQSPGSVRMTDQVGRQLGHREHVDQVEVQLHIGDPGAAAARAQQLPGPGAARARVVLPVGGHRNPGWPCAAESPRAASWPGGLVIGGSIRSL